MSRLCKAALTYRCHASGRDRLEVKRAQAARLGLAAGGTELTAFQQQALSRLAAQHDEIDRLRGSLARTDGQRALRWPS